MVVGGEAEGEWVVKQEGEQSMWRWKLWRD